MVHLPGGERKDPGESEDIPLSELKSILEAILFSSAKPVTLKKLQKKLEEYQPPEIEEAMRALKDEYGVSGRAVEIAEVAGGFQMRTILKYRDWVRRFVKEKEVSLTRAMLETLSIIAYKQPIAKREVDTLRGVDSIRCIKQLLDRNLIEVAGRNSDAGRPMIFRTTLRFLEVFGLRDIRDLPTVRELEALEK
jgi:segregation and condensation protein B